MHNSNSQTRGFSLVEVILAVGLVAIAIPTMLGIFSYLSQASMETKDRDDVRSIISIVRIYLETEAGSTDGTDGTAPDGGTFPFVYNWVKTASDDEDSAKLLYVYKFILDESEIVSDRAPNNAEISNLDSRLMVVEIHAPDETILPPVQLPIDVADYQRAYLPLELKVYAVLTADEERGNLNFVESIPLVLSR